MAQKIAVIAARARDTSLATSRYLEAASDSLTDWRAARILGDGDWPIRTDQRSDV